MAPSRGYRWLKDAWALIPRCGLSWLALVSVLLFLVAFAVMSKAAQFGAIALIVFIGARVAAVADKKGRCSAEQTLSVVVTELPWATVGAGALVGLGWCLSGFADNFFFAPLMRPYVETLRDPLALHRVLLPAVIPAMYCTTMITLTGLLTYPALRRHDKNELRALLAAWPSAFSALMLAAGSLVMFLLLSGLLASVLLPVAIVWFSSLCQVAYRDVAEQVLPMEVGEPNAHRSEG